MRVLPASLLALPAVTLAQQQQIPLLDQAKGLYNKAASYVQGAASAANPVEAAASTVAAHNVHQLTFDNWRQTLTHSGESWGDNSPENWMVYVTGGNKTCRGHCERTDKAWNESILLLQTDKTAPSLATMNCDTQELLCGSWGANTGTIWFYQIPHPMPSQSSASTTLTIHPLNFTTATNADITRIHTRKLYLEPKLRYEGALHPIDGWVTRTGLVYPMAYGLWTLAHVPSWAFMIGVSLFSRQFMARRTPQPGARAGQGAQGGAAPAAPAAAS